LAAELVVVVVVVVLVVVVAAVFAAGVQSGKLGLSRPHDWIFRVTL